MVFFKARKAHMVDIKSYGFLAKWKLNNIFGTFKFLCFEDVKLYV